MANVVVLHPTKRTSGTARGKIDTGADITVLPDGLVAQLGINPKGQVWTKGFDSSYSLRPLFYVALTIEGISLPIVRCVAANRQNILLGRNVLNRFLILLDGKKLTFEIKKT